MPGVEPGVERGEEEGGGGGGGHCWNGVMYIQSTLSDQWLLISDH